MCLGNPKPCILLTKHCILTFQDSREKASIWERPLWPLPSSGAALHLPMVFNSSYGRDCTTLLIDHLKSGLNQLQYGLGFWGCVWGEVGVFIPPALFWHRSSGFRTLNRSLGEMWFLPNFSGSLTAFSNALYDLGHQVCNHSDWAHSSGAQTWVALGGHAKVMSF